MTTVKLLFTNTQPMYSFKDLLQKINNIKGISPSAVHMTVTVVRLTRSQLSHSAPWWQNATEHKGLHSVTEKQNISCRKKK